MPSSNPSRRGFMSAAAMWAAPASTQTAIQNAGIKPDDLGIKEVKVYVLRSRPGTGSGGAEQQLASIVTALDHAVHFYCELAMPNNTWFEMT